MVVSALEEEAEVSPDLLEVALGRGIYQRKRNQARTIIHFGYGMVPLGYRFNVETFLLKAFLNYLKRGFCTASVTGFLTSLKIHC